MVIVFNNWIFRPSSNWQYLNDKGVHDSAQADTRARFQFDEVHSLLPGVQLQKRRCGFTREKQVRRRPLRP